MPSATTVRRRARAEPGWRMAETRKRPTRAFLKVFLPDSALLNSARVKQMLFKNPKFGRDPLKFFSEVNKTVKYLIEAPGPYGLKVTFLAPESIKEAGGPAKAREVLADITNARSMIRFKSRTAESISEVVFDDVVEKSHSLLDLKKRLDKLLDKRHPTELINAVKQARRELTRHRV